MLVPLTASLYVPGMLDDSEKVLVDVGTGYFIEVFFFLLFYCVFLSLYNLEDLHRFHLMNLILHI